MQAPKCSNARSPSVPREYSLRRSTAVTSWAATLPTVGTSTFEMPSERSFSGRYRRNETRNASIRSRSGSRANRSFLRVR